MHVAHVDDNYMFKCDKITGYDPYSEPMKFMKKLILSIFQKLKMLIY